MDKKKAKERAEKLRKEIEKYRYAYHVLDQSLISDEALDSLKKELFDLEQKFPDLITPDSPTQRIGGKPLEKFRKVEHEAPMLSFNDAFSGEDMRAWLERLENYLGSSLIKRADTVFLQPSQPSGHGVPRSGTSEARTNERAAGRAKRVEESSSASAAFYCELKIDGLAIELIYENGIFVQGSTRGDGLVGEDVTQNLKTIEAIPLRLRTPDAKRPIPKKLIIRGEIFLTKKEFERINKEQEKTGKKIYANPRNIAAGSVRQLDPKITASRKLDSFQYDIVTDLGQKTHEEEHEILKSFGFKINPHNKAAVSIDEVFRFHEYWSKEREKLPYEIDGIVVIVNENKDFEDGGVIGKAPRAAIAYKFASKEAVTVIEDIKIQIGRTGVLTPVAVLRPAQVSGITITHATLHNADEIKRLDVRVGDTVIVSRAGDVIPKITEVLKNLRPKGAKEFKMPEVCPVDGSKTAREGVFYRCGNPKCGARQRAQLCHFVSRGAFDIRGLGPKIIDRFLDEGLIGDAPDIFELKEGDIAVLERFGKKSAKNIVEEVNAKKKISLSRFIYSLGILHVGEETGRLLAERFAADKIKASAGGGSAFGRQNSKLATKRIAHFFQNFSLEQLQEIPDIGPKVAQSIYDWFRDERHIKLLDKFDKTGLEIKAEKSAGANGKLKGLSFVLTGGLESISRAQAKEKIRALGGDVNESVSKNTSYVVVGSEAGSKLEKAKRLGVKILSEKEFLAMLK